MKIVAIFMAVVAAMTVHSTVGQECFVHYTRAEAGTAGGNTFTGIVNGTTTEDYNNPLWYVQADAQAGFTSPTAPTGRLSGSLALTNFEGTLSFDFFKRRLFFFRNKLTITFSKATSSGTITGGSGCYRGISGGTAVRTRVGDTIPRVFKWEFCPTSAARCAPK